jgi:hypothetical protein
MPENLDSYWIWSNTHNEKDVTSVFPYLGFENYPMHGF